MEHQRYETSGPGRHLSWCICSGLLVIMLMSGSWADCPNRESSGLNLVITHDGLGGQPANREKLQEVFGSCRNVDSNTEEVFKYFESLGFDMTIPRQNPYQNHVTDEYNLKPFVQGTPGCAVLTGFRNRWAGTPRTKVYRNFWFFTTGTSFESSNGFLNNGTTYIIGVIRLNLWGRDYCIDYRSDSPLASVDNGVFTYRVYDWTIYNEFWGTGTGQGIVTLRDPMRRQSSLVLNFPHSSAGYY